MASLQAAYGGASYVAAWQASHDDAAKVNGLDGADPRLSNAQLAALVRGWTRCAARSSAPLWPEAYELTIAALGYAKPGDRFDMTAAHQAAPAPSALVAFFWHASHDLADRLDHDGTKQERLYVDWSAGGYQQAARDAWQRMQLERAAAAAASTSTPPPAPVATSKGSGMGWLAMLLAALLLGGKKRRS